MDAKKSTGTKSQERKERLPGERRPPGARGCWGQGILLNEHEAGRPIVLGGQTRTWRRQKSWEDPPHSVWLERRGGNWGGRAEWNPLWSFHTWRTESYQNVGLEQKQDRSRHKYLKTFELEVTWSGDPASRASWRPRGPSPGSLVMEGMCSCWGKTQLLYPFTHPSGMQQKWRRSEEEM